MHTSAQKYYYQFTEDKLAEGVNPLVYLIVHKPKWYDLKQRWFMYRYKKFITKVYTPSFLFLCAIYDFIITAENTFMYPNTKDKLFAYRNLKKNVKSFLLPVSKVFKDSKNETEFVSNYIIEYTMYLDTKTINIKIRREYGSNISTSITFQADIPMMLSNADVIMFNDVITNTMSMLWKIFDMCYTSTQHIPLRDEHVNKDCFEHS